MPELWDVLDADRQPTGRTVERIESGGDPSGNLQPGDFHVVVSVIVFSGSEILIQQRADDKESWPGWWDITAGGSVLAGETSRQGAARELAEEVGLQVDLSGQRPILVTSSATEFQDYYAVDAPKDLDIEHLQLQESEVQAVRWATRDDVVAMTIAGEFVPYQSGFIDLLFSLHHRPGTMSRTWFSH